MYVHLWYTPFLRPNGHWDPSTAWIWTEAFILVHTVYKNHPLPRFPGARTCTPNSSHVCAHARSQVPPKNVQFNMPFFMTSLYMIIHVTTFLLSQTAQCKGCRSEDAIQRECHPVRPGPRQHYGLPGLSTDLRGPRQVPALMWAAPWFCVKRALKELYTEISTRGGRLPSPG